MDQFVRADSTNLPKIDYLMILEYMTTSDKHNIAEIRGAKALVSSRDSYVDSAVGFVEVKRNQMECIVRGKVVPEHRISTRQCIVSVTIDETNHVIAQATCDGCAASAGGCKHALVFLSWLDKRSSEPASTSVQCYWSKPNLSGVRSNPVKSEDIFPNSKKVKLTPKDPNVLTRFLEESKKQNVTHSLAICFSSPKVSYNIFDLAVEFLETEVEDYEKFMSFVNEKITPDIVHEINIKTKSQAHSKLWHSIRQGRITASKIYEASRCNIDGSLVQHILGGYKVPETEFINRGKRLENNVIEETEKKINKKIEKSGFILINGVVGASPDGVGEDFVVEVKCPASNNSLKSYVDNGIIHSKYIAQMQTQMCAAKKAKAVFCIADPKFEENKNVHIYWLNYDSEFTANLIEKAMTFWKTYVYKKIILSART